MPDAENIIVESIQRLLTRRGAGGLEITHEATFARDLDMDSLELAELSADLEERLGHDPYTKGIVPETVGALIKYYDE